MPRAGGELPLRIEILLGGLGGGISSIAAGTAARAAGLSPAPLWLLLVLGVAVGVDSAAVIRRPPRAAGRHVGSLGLLRGCLLFGSLSTSVGMPFLLPLGATISAIAFLLHAGAAAWKTALGGTLVTSLIGLVIAALLAHQGLLVEPFPHGIMVLVHLVVMVAGLGIIGTTARVISQRDAGEQALAAERAARHAELVHASHHDHLTGVLNRAGLAGSIAEALRSAAPGHGVGLLYLDLDGFKAVNDTLGHPAGDELLVCVARRLQDVVRPGDHVARLGGDEFVVLVTDLTAPGVLTALGERTEQALVQPYAIHGLPATIGASIGAAMTEDALTSADDLFARADRAMYEVKYRHHRATAGV